MEDRNDDVIWIGRQVGLYHGPGMEALCYPDCVALRPMRDHMKLHDLNNAKSEKIMLIWYLMRITGNIVGSEQTGVLSYLVHDGQSMTDQLRVRGYLLAETPLDAVMRELTVPMLKDELKAHGLRVGGNRAELVDRLMPALTPQDENRLRKQHSVWTPSALGYEMLYSYYMLWENREWAVVCAIAKRDENEIVEAMLSLMSLYPVRDGMCIDKRNIHNVLTTLSWRAMDQIDLMDAFQWITGFQVQFNFHVPDWRIDNTGAQL